MNSSLELNQTSPPPSVTLLYVVSVSVVLSSICCITLLGNLLVIVAVLTTRSLHTVTNSFIVSLGVADMLVSILVMPMSIYAVIYHEWRFGSILCDLWISSDVLLCTASILNLCCISLDRYFAITRPLTYSRQRSPKLARTMIALVWLVSLLISCPPVFGWKDQKRYENPNQCTLNLLLSYRIYSSLGSFFLPCLIMVFVYSRIFRVIHKREKYLKSNASIMSSASSRRTSRTGLINHPNHVAGRYSLSASASRFIFTSGFPVNNNNTNNSGYSPNSPSNRTENIRLMTLNEADICCSSEALSNNNNNSTEENQDLSLIKSNEPGAAVNPASPAQSDLLKLNKENGHFSSSSSNSPTGSERKLKNMIGQKSARRRSEYFCVKCPPHGNKILSLVSCTSNDSNDQPGANSCSHHNSSGLVDASPSNQAQFSSSSKHVNNNIKSANNQTCSSTIKKNKKSKNGNSHVIVTHHFTNNNRQPTSLMNIKSSANFNRSTSLRSQSISKIMMINQSTESRGDSRSLFCFKFPSRSSSATSTTGKSAALAVVPVSDQTSGSLNNELLAYVRQSPVASLKKKPPLIKSATDDNLTNRITFMSKNKFKRPSDLNMITLRSNGSFAQLQHPCMGSEKLSRKKFSTQTSMSMLSSSNGAQEQQMRMLSENKAAKTLAIVVGGFIVSWMPFFVMYVLEAIVKPGTITKTLADTITWLGYVNSAINPIIYAYCSKQFRAAFYRITIGKCRSRGSNNNNNSGGNSRHPNYYYQDKKFQQHRLYYTNSVIYNSNKNRLNSMNNGHMIVSGSSNGPSPAILSSSSTTTTNTRPQKYSLVSNGL